MTPRLLWQVVAVRKVVQVRRGGRASHGHRRAHGQVEPGQVCDQPAAACWLRLLAAAGFRATGPGPRAVYLMHNDEGATLDAYGSQMIPALIR